jgi:CheY-like chemotaxis protein
LLYSRSLCEDLLPFGQEREYFLGPILGKRFLTGFTASVNVGSRYSKKARPTPMPFPKPSGCGDRSNTPIRLLVVDDYEPFRRFICSKVGQRPDLCVVGEASDGLEAVQKAEKLRPDLIVLDIGLPTLNGLEAARRIRKLSPESKILFVSQESSADVAQEALSLGALGYVVKAHAGRELLAALKRGMSGPDVCHSGIVGS